MCPHNCWPTQKLGDWVYNTQGVQTWLNNISGFGRSCSTMNIHLRLYLVLEPDLLDPEILFSCVCTPSVLYTYSPNLLANSFDDPWYWASCSIFPWYLPYKRKHCNTAVYGIVLYCKQYLWLCERDCESVKRKCSGIAAGCIPSYFWTIIKGLAISLWM